MVPPMVVVVGDGLVVVVVVVEGSGAPVLSIGMSTVLPRTEGVGTSVAGDVEETGVCCRQRVLSAYRLGSTGQWVV